MPTFKYDALAELFVPKSGRFRNAPLTYKRFERAADAVRYALEEVPPEKLASAFLEVEDERFDSKGIRALYESEDYPLPRRARKTDGPTTRPTGDGLRR
ncbi:MAG TPA: hypothetical protein VJL84_02220 [Kiloniellales bacterium]|nr:hypothetical protein [Kiloniellales bacterium]